MKYLITSPTCPACHEAKERLKDALEKGEIKELSIETDEGADMVLKMNLNAVPVLIDCDDKKCKLVSE